MNAKVRKIFLYTKKNVESDNSYIKNSFKPSNHRALTLGLEAQPLINHVTPITIKHGASLSSMKTEKTNSISYNEIESLRNSSQEKKNREFYSENSRTNIKRKLFEKINEPKKYIVEEFEYKQNEFTPTIQYQSIRCCCPLNIQMNKYTDFLNHKKNSVASEYRVCEIFQENINKIEPSCLIPELEIIPKNLKDSNAKYENNSLNKIISRNSNSNSENFDRNKSFAKNNLNSIQFKKWKLIDKSKFINKGNIHGIKPFLESQKSIERKMEKNIESSNNALEIAIDKNQKIHKFNGVSYNVKTCIKCNSEIKQKTETRNTYMKNQAIRVKEKFNNSLGLNSFLKNEVDSRFTINKPSFKSFIKPDKNYSFLNI